MWIAFACGSAFFAGITAILAKCGIRETDSTVATAIRTVVVLIFAWSMVFVVGSFEQIATISAYTWAFLILSGLATGASWLCYFKALQLGDVNKVVPIDKSSTVLTMLLALVFLGETFSWVSGVAMVLILMGTFLMIERRSETEKGTSDSGIPTKNALGRRGWSNSWLLFAVLSAVFASLTALLGKVGIEGVESNLGTAIRTVVVLIMAWVMVVVTNKRTALHGISKRELTFICLSGLATGASWLCFYRALQDGLASVVVPIDKLSILVTIVFSYVVFKEKLTRRSGFGLVLIVVGTLLMTLTTL